ncbi:MAG: nucleotidyltransferase domain-containing protein [Deltaproteobacteria bacterium]|nr:nucleotidyltransferase domain-containing protein [Deltaproteobacteria bacterium]
MNGKLNKAIDEYTKLLKKQYGSIILQAMLFGSAARGENDRDSDIDILIVVPDKYDRLKDEISMSAYEVALKNNMVFSPIVMDKSTFDWHRINKDPFYKNVHRDGIELWTKASENLSKSV